MIAGLFAALVSFAWRRSERLALALPAQKAAALAGFLAAFAYCLISGFAVPAQRTLYMVGVVAATLWLGRATSASRVLAAALLVVLVLDPWAILSPGFWLCPPRSPIFHVSTGQTVKAGSRRGRVQWAVTVGLALMPCCSSRYRSSRRSPTRSRYRSSVFVRRSRCSARCRPERRSSWGTPFSMP
jgi:competence protein ComEC